MCTMCKKLKMEKVRSTWSPWHVHRRSINNCQLEPGAHGNGRDRAISCHCSLPLRLDMGDDLPSCGFPNESWLMLSVVTGKQTYQAFLASRAALASLDCDGMELSILIRSWNFQSASTLGALMYPIWHFPCSSLFCLLSRIKCLGLDGVPPYPWTRWPNRSPR